MAMSREDQKAASDRIMAKYPLTEEELVIYRRLTRKPDDYTGPAEKRICADCGTVFSDTVNSKGDIQVSALEKFSDHQAEHNPSPAQWSEAHKRIQAAKPSTRAT